MQFLPVNAKPLSIHSPHNPKLHPRGKSRQMTLQRVVKPMFKQSLSRIYATPQPLLSRILRRRTTSSNLLKLQLPLIHLLKLPRCSLQLPSNSLLQLLAILRTLVSLIIGQWSQTIVRIDIFFILFVGGCTSLCAVGPFGSWLLTFGRRPGVSRSLERRWCSSGWDGGSSTPCSYSEI